MKCLELPSAHYSLFSFLLNVFSVSRISNICSFSPSWVSFKIYQTSTQFISHMIIYSPLRDIFSTGSLSCSPAHILRSCVLFCHKMFSSGESFLLLSPSPFVSDYLSKLEFMIFILSALAINDWSFFPTNELLVNKWTAGLWRNRGIINGECERCWKFRRVCFFRRYFLELL